MIPATSEAPIRFAVWILCAASQTRVRQEHCPNCGGRLKIIAPIEAPSVTGRILAHLGLPAHSPPRVLRRLSALVDAS